MSFEAHIAEKIKGLVSAKIAGNLREINIRKIDQGIILIYATWSLTAIHNITQTLEVLGKRNYQAPVYILPTDSIAAEESLLTFGQVLGGNGEIFVVSHGKIIKRYFGKTAANDFLKDLPTRV